MILAGEGRRVIGSGSTGRHCGAKSQPDTLNSITDTDLYLRHRSSEFRSRPTGNGCGNIASICFCAAHLARHPSRAGRWDLSSVRSPWPRTRRLELRVLRPVVR
eukprot:scaffold1219_cov400-Prasinococcus_capsulatus_cf.AAC.23